ncbi:phosphate acyltransferase PlsX [Thermoclostridium stercorarium subsp. stercorarium DSM 8532]|uniref:Phosphate acyltransferase n=3 Tax=Thermoclostridium stercorarium TaxID=1510 RepID=L7VRH3_THES1|nr:phosphate acyltransferase PlsX [Thermoclostridium stercorarium]AGC68148.1 phosphate acyltransferase PlsX [Thermoclostridium stercorarium subsp. stercorarium DSM 8532]AGI39174.1 phosphate-acyl-acyl carrier protein acyltransferase [Thermoclostridium stercorarium subsp. stercorarium DSM 8532]ANW98523.1 phosphate acyltransferase [Thermoclostridium stercorarium subsp. thermolacticum DSM 2910]ANX01058.1 phosphate acyltransferase [Thermoclostridium stercorarium subsp. leptospartum DSM 9219]
MRIMVDAMGGDNAPEEIVKGCIEALKSKEGFDIELIGIEEEIEKYLNKYGYNGNRILITHAPEVIYNDDKPTEAIRHKKNSSMVIGLGKIRNNEGEIFISAGSTGALLVGTLLVAGTIKGVLRPALAPVVPSMCGGTMIVDAGMNTQCRPVNYVQFAVMGSAYMEHVYKRENPRIGLVNIGTEDEKGNNTLREALSLLRKCDLNFIGNIEGRDIAEGKVDVAVCDGFTGNAMLKMMEGTGKYFFHHMKRIFNRSLFSKISALLVKTHLKKLKDSVDPEITGGTPILGANGLIFKCHGNSTARAIQNTIINAYAISSSGFIEKIRERIGNMEV